MKRALIIVLVIITTSCSTRNDLDITDYPMVTTINEISEYYGLKIDTSGKYETSSITNYFDGTMELEYSYELLESEAYDPLFYSISIEKERTVKDAKELYFLSKAAVKLVGNSFKQSTVAIDSLQLSGDDTYYALRMFEGVPNGMFYMVRKETVVYTMMVSGFYTTDHSLINDLLIPKITHLAEFKLIE